MQIRDAVDGKILVGVENAPDAAIIERALTVPGATVKRQE